VAVVCSFNYDEPLPAIIEAARLVPDVHFCVTGNPKHLAADLKARMPANMRLTGFLSTEAYGALVRGADVVLTLTTRDHTMLRGAYEAIYQGTPVIVSNWQLLRTAFPEGALHVDNTAEQIAAAIRRAQTGTAALRAGAARLRARKSQDFMSTLAALRERLVGARMVAVGRE
jgi:glycosyltransferase involved in cell wall biosynthesis